MRVPWQSTCNGTCDARHMHKGGVMYSLTEIMNENATFVMRLLVAMTLGGLVGMERQMRGRSAGLRTNILVCLGSAGIIVAFQKLAIDLGVGAESSIRMDPARAAAGVITGIGFLGAGTIVKSNDFVRGLTTAASIWVVSAIGVIAGLGEYSIASILTILVLLSLYALHLIPINADRYFSLRMRWHGNITLLDETIARLIADDVQIKSKKIVSRPKVGDFDVILSVCLRTNSDDYLMMNQLYKDERFDEISWN